MVTNSSYITTNMTTMDPTTYKSAIDANFNVIQRIATMFACYPSSVPAMNVNLLPGAVLNGVTLTTTAVQTSSTITAPSSANAQRIDRVMVSKASGGLLYVTGTASSAPAAPAISSGYLPVAQILLSTATIAIDNSLLTDERTLYVF